MEREGKREGKQVRARRQHARPKGSTQKRASAAASQSPSTAFDPQRVWQLVRRRRFYLALPLVVIGIVVGLGLQTITPVFICTSAIQIEERDVNTRQLDRLISAPQMERLRDRSRVAVVQGKIGSQELLLRVIRNLRLREDPSVVREATALQQDKLPEQTVSIIAERILVRRLRQKLFVRGMPGNMFLVSVEDNDPNTAFKLNEAITQAFVDLIKKEGHEQLLETDTFTDEQYQQALRQLQDVEEELQEFKKTMVVASELSGNPINKSNSRWAENLVRRARLDQQETLNELEAVRDQLLAQGLGPTTLGAILEDHAVVNMQERLLTLEREDYLRQLETGTERSRTALTSERQRIGVRRNQLNQRISELVDQYFLDQGAETRDLLVQLHELEVVLAVLTQYRGVISQEYNVYASKIQSQPEQEAELRRLENAVDRADEHWQTLAMARRSGELTQGASDSGFGTVVRVVDPATKPLFPAKPNRLKIALMAAVLALGIGIGAVFLAEYVDTSFKDVRELSERTGLEVLGTLPRFAGEFKWEARKRRATLMWRTAFVVTLVAVMTLFVLYYKRSTVQNRVELVSEQGVGEVGGSR